MAMMMMLLPAGIVGVIVLLVLMFLLILLFILLACKPWRFLPSFSSSSYSSSAARSRAPLPKADDLERPLVSDDVSVHDQNYELVRNSEIEGACCQSEGLLRSPRTHGLSHKPRIPSAPPHFSQGDSLVLDVASDPAEDLWVGQTLKRPILTEHLAGQRPVTQKDRSPNFQSGSGSDVFREFVPKVISDQRSSLSLEVISGPSHGLCCSVLSTNATRLPLTLGRVSTDLQLKDSEVSGKHAMINWNVDKKKWELVDMGSLNGTLLNSQPINHPDSGSRHWGDPVELSSGDIITLGTTTNVHVHVESKSESQTPFGMGIASDPMVARRGGKKLPMEDVCYYYWPLPGINQFGVFGVCDGHGGVAAANSASKMLPEKVTHILSDSVTRERVLSQCDASDVLRNAFTQTEASMNNYYEGCTATVLLVWADGGEKFFVQCANVGDSACIMNVDGKQIKMTEDHRITSHGERLRINKTGEPLKDGETRLCGLNLGRMLGDKFLKQQEARFSSEPYISEVVHINEASSGFALMASDGFWDVINVKKAIQLVLQARERHSTEGENPAEKVADVLLSEAKSLRTKDNTSIIFVDFGQISRLASCKVDS